MKKLILTLFVFFASRAIFCQGIQALDNSNSHFRYATIYDWDCCLFGPGFNDGQPYDYPVDGHFKVRYDETGQGTVVEATGSYASTNPVGSSYNRDFGFSSNPTYKSLIVDNLCCNSIGDRIYVELSEEIIISSMETEIVASKTPFAVAAYPNPCTKSFNLSLTTKSGAKIVVEVYDMIGKLIEKREMEPTEIPASDIGSLNPSGVYKIIVRQGTEVQTLSVIKE